MNTDAIRQHYGQGGGLLETIRHALEKTGKLPGQLGVEDLGAVDEFHTGGRKATRIFLDHLQFVREQHILDIGCGIGGTARLLASEYACRVTGIDLTAEYVETGSSLCEWTGLGDRITLVQGSALDTGFADGEFDGACMLHVGMNIAAKEQLFSETGRVLKPGARLGIYDVMSLSARSPAFPVPWATTPQTSFLASPAEYSNALQAAGFVLEAEHNQREFALEFMAEMRRKNAGTGETPPLGLHLMMGDSAALKIRNMVKAMADGDLAPVEIVARKKAAD